MWKHPSPDPGLSHAIKTRNPAPYWVFDRCWGKTEAPDVLTLNFLLPQRAAWQGAPSVGEKWDYLWDGISCPLVTGKSQLCLCCKISSCAQVGDPSFTATAAFFAEGEGSDGSLMLWWLSYHSEVVPCIISACRSSTQTGFIGLEAALHRPPGSKLPPAWSLPHKRGLIFLSISILQLPVCKKRCSQPDNRSDSQWKLTLPFEYPMFFNLSDWSGHITRKIVWEQWKIFLLAIQQHMFF